MVPRHEISLKTFFSSDITLYLMNHRNIILLAIIISIVAFTVFSYFRAREIATDYMIIGPGNMGRITSELWIWHEIPYVTGAARVGLAWEVSFGGVWTSRTNSSLTWPFPGRGRQVYVDFFTGEIVNPGAELV